MSVNVLFTRGKWRKGGFVVPMKIVPPIGSTLVLDSSLSPYLNWGWPKALAGAVITVRRKLASVGTGDFGMLLQVQYSLPRANKPKKRT